MAVGKTADLDQLSAAADAAFPDVSYVASTLAPGVQTLSQSPPPPACEAGRRPQSYLEKHELCFFFDINGLEFASGRCRGFEQLNR
jgi:hypothetical protein